MIWFNDRENKMYAKSCTNNLGLSVIAFMIPSLQNLFAISYYLFKLNDTWLLLGNAYLLLVNTYLLLLTTYLLGVFIVVS